MVQNLSTHVCYVVLVFAPFLSYPIGSVNAGALQQAETVASRETGNYNQEYDISFYENNHIGSRNRKKRMLSRRALTLSSTFAVPLVIFTFWKPAPKEALPAEVMQLQTLTAGFNRRRIAFPAATRIIGDPQSSPQPVPSAQNKTKNIDNQINSRPRAVPRTSTGVQQIALYQQRFDQERPSILKLVEAAGFATSEAESGEELPGIAAEEPKVEEERRATAEECKDFIEGFTEYALSLGELITNKEGQEELDFHPEKMTIDNKYVDFSITHLSDVVRKAKESQPAISSAPDEELMEVVKLKLFDQLVMVLVIWQKSKPSEMHYRLPDLEKLDKYFIGEHAKNLRASTKSQKTVPSKTAQSQTDVLAESNKRRVESASKEADREKIRAQWKREREEWAKEYVIIKAESERIFRKLGL